jgi:hypothetical protein
MGWYRLGSSDWALVNTVINLGKFMSIWKTFGFSRRARLYAVSFFVLMSLRHDLLYFFQGCCYFILPRSKYFLQHPVLKHPITFWRENVFKIVPVQVPIKLEMWQNYVAFVFVITYVLQAMWPCVVHILIIDHRPLLSMRIPHVCVLTSSFG